MPWNLLSHKIHMNALVDNYGSKVYGFHQSADEYAQGKNHERWERSMYCILSISAHLPEISPSVLCQFELWEGEIKGIFIAGVACLYWLFLQQFPQWQTLQISPGCISGASLCSAHLTAAIFHLELQNAQIFRESTGERRWFMGNRSGDLESMLGIYSTFQVYLSFSLSISSTHHLI